MKTNNSYKKNLKNKVNKGEKNMFVEIVLN